MNKEVGYVWQGALLMVVVLIGMWFIQILANIKVAAPIVSEGPLATGVKEVKIVHTADSRAGKEIFDNSCANCHRVNKDLAGPALVGIEGRVKDKQLLYSWIRNNEAVLKSGNLYFNELFVKWNKTSMSVFPAISDKEIDQILAYIRVYEVSAIP